MGLGSGDIDLGLGSWHIGLGLGFRFWDIGFGIGSSGYRFWVCANISRFPAHIWTFYQKSVDRTVHI